MGKAGYRAATKSDLLTWLEEGIFWVAKDTGPTPEVYRRGNPKPLTQYISTRNRMEGGDPRVHLRYQNKRISVHVSQLTWMSTTMDVIPPDFQIHHIDGDPLNNSYDNLVCIHKDDHIKLHRKLGDIPDDEEIPF